MPLRLGYRGLTVWRHGYAGVVVEVDGKRLCIDVVEALDCSARLYSHDHPRHYGGVDENLVAAPFIGTRPGDTVDLGWARVVALPAYNVDGGPHRRGCCLGFLVEAGGARLFFAGDTDLVPEHAGIASPHVAVVPIGGGAVMEAEEAAELVKTVRPAVTVPTHYDRPESLWVFRDIVQPYTQVVVLKPVTGGGGAGGAIRHG